MSKLVKYLQEKTRETVDEVDYRTPNSFYKRPEFYEFLNYYRFSYITDGTKLPLDINRNYTETLTFEISPDVMNLNNSYIQYFINLPKLAAHKQYVLYNTFGIRSLRVIDSDGGDLLREIESGYQLYTDFMRKLSTNINDQIMHNDEYFDGLTMEFDNNDKTYYLANRTYPINMLNPNDTTPAPAADALNIEYNGKRELVKIKLEYLYNSILAYLEDIYFGQTIKIEIGFYNKSYFGYVETYNATNTEITGPKEELPDFKLSDFRLYLSYNKGETGSKRIRDLYLGMNEYLGNPSPIFYNQVRLEYKTKKFENDDIIFDHSFTIANPVMLKGILLLITKNSFGIGEDPTDLWSMDPNDGEIFFYKNDELQTTLPYETKYKIDYYEMRNLIKGSIYDKLTKDNYSYYNKYFFWFKYTDSNHMDDMNDITSINIAPGSVPSTKFGFRIKSNTFNNQFLKFNFFKLFVYKAKVNGSRIEYFQSNN